MKSRSWFLVLSAVGAAAMLVLGGIQQVLAVGGYPAEAFGIKPVTAVQGVKANIWTAQQPPNYVYIRGLVAVCRNNPCTNTSGAFETGYTKGTKSNCGTINQLQQFIGYRTIGGSLNVVCGLGNLSNNTWYNFQVQYDNTAARWKAYRNGGLVYTHPQSLGFTNASLAMCGAAGSNGLPPLGVECGNMQYAVNGGQWTLYDYTATEVRGAYCVYKPYAFGAFGWGPC